MNWYEQKQADRRERYAERAEKLRGTARGEFRKADLREEVSGIPFGQPILVGHHSEGRHRRAIARADNAMRRGIEASDKADHYEARANTVNRAVSSDDPDAVVKLREKVAKLKERQELMKAANKLVRKKDVAGLAALVGEKAAGGLMSPDFAGRLGFPSYELTNNNANIRRIEQRIGELEQSAETEPAEDIKGDGWMLHEDTEENRVMFEFDGKPPADTRAMLKSHGFKWSPSRVAWVRMLNNAGRYAAQQVVAALEAA